MAKSIVVERRIRWRIFRLRLVGSKRRFSSHRTIIGDTVVGAPDVLEQLLIDLAQRWSVAGQTVGLVSCWNRLFSDRVIGRVGRRSQRTLHALDAPVAVAVAGRSRAHTLTIAGIGCIAAFTLVGSVGVVHVLVRHDDWWKEAEIRIELSKNRLSNRHFHEPTHTRGQQAKELRSTRSNYLWYGLTWTTAGKKKKNKDLCRKNGSEPYRSGRNIPARDEATRRAWEPF